MTGSARMCPDVGTFWAPSVSVESRRTKTVESIRIDGDIPLAAKRSLVLSHRLLCGAEAIMCPIRCHGRIPQENRIPAEEADFWYLVAAALGAAGEAMALVKDTSASLLTEHLFASDPSCIETLKELRSAKPSKVTILARRMRDKYWAHKDKEISEAFVATLTGRESDPPLMETSGKGEIATTACPWVAKAWMLDIEEMLGPSTSELAATNTHEAIEHLQKVAELARLGAVRLIEAAGVPLKKQSGGNR